MSKTGTGVRHLPPANGRDNREPIKTFSTSEVWALEVRKLKRAAKAVGIVDETPNYWSYVVVIAGVTHTGRVMAISRSEARAATKKELGFKKFPKGATIGLADQGQNVKPKGGFVG